MKAMLRDHRTGIIYPAAIAESWGRNGVGDGYGPVPVAFHLIPTPAAGPDPYTGKPKLQTFEASGGTLDFVELADGRAAQAEKDFKKLRFTRPFLLAGLVVGRPQLELLEDDDTSDPEDDNGA